MSSDSLNLRELGDNDSLGINVLEMTHAAIHPHTHSFYELVYIKSGFCLHETGNRTALLIEGDFFIMKPGQWHRYIGPHAVELYNCLFEKRVLDSMFDGELSRMPGVASDAEAEPCVKLHLDIVDQKRVVRLLKGMMYECANREQGWEIAVKNRLSELLVEYTRAYRRFAMTGRENSVYSNYVVGALEIISNRFNDPGLTIAGIASLVGVTPDYLSRQFRLLTGVGAQEYLRRFRFSKATELLVGGASVSDTCRDVGFTNLCHFSREFKKELGVTPTQFTKANT